MARTKARAFTGRYLSVAKVNASNLKKIQISGEDDNLQFALKRFGLAVENKESNARGVSHGLNSDLENA